MMKVLRYQEFLTTLPVQVLDHLPNQLQLNVRQPNRWLVQFYDQDKHVHYEIQRIARQSSASAPRDFELGLHFESKRKPLNAHLLAGFSRRLIEVHVALGDSISAEPWDRGWAKVYDVYPGAPLTEAFQQQLAARMALMIQCLHPILLELYDTPVERKVLYSL